MQQKKVPGEENLAALKRVEGQVSSETVFERKPIRTNIDMTKDTLMAGSVRLSQPVTNKTVCRENHLKKKKKKNCLNFTRLKMIMTVLVFIKCHYDVISM